MLTSSLMSLNYKLAQKYPSLPLSLSLPFCIFVSLLFYPFLSPNLYLNFSLSLYNYISLYLSFSSSLTLSRHVSLSLTIYFFATSLSSSLFLCHPISRHVSLSLSIHLSPLTIANIT